MPSAASRRSLPRVVASSAPAARAAAPATSSGDRIAQTYSDHVCAKYHPESQLAAWKYAITRSVAPTSASRPCHAAARASRPPSKRHRPAERDGGGAGGGVGGGSPPSLATGADSPSSESAAVAAVETRRLSSSASVSSESRAAAALAGSAPWSTR